jgi:hypothetical protein
MRTENPLLIFLHQMATPGPFATFASSRSAGKLYTLRFALAAKDLPALDVSDAFAAEELPSPMMLTRAGLLAVAFLEVGVVFLFLALAFFALAFVLWTRLATGAPTGAAFEAEAFWALAAMVAEACAA